MYYFAACDDDGRCFGIVANDYSVSTDPDNEMDKLMCFKKKSDANLKAMQINLGNMLLPNGVKYRVAVVRG